MRINKNLKSIQAASGKFGSAYFPASNKYDFHKAIIYFNIEKNFFSIIFLKSETYNAEIYEDSDTTYFELERSTLLSIVSFHVGLILPKEKRRVVRTIAKLVIAEMKLKHAYSYIGYYGHSKSFEQYIIPISNFITLVESSV